MARFMRGDVVVIPFSFSDLSQSKRRPTLVISNSQSNDIILCQITSKIKNDPYGILLTNQDFRYGELSRKSYIRPHRIFTADQNLIIYKIGQIDVKKLDEVITTIVEIIS